MQRIVKINNKEVLYPKLSYTVCGLCFKVHNKLGRFRNEQQYADAFEEFLKENKIKEDYFQMRRYLASSGYRLGIIINFRQKILSPKRVLNTKPKHS